MRAARLCDWCVWCGTSFVPPSVRRVGVGVVEGVEGALGRDRELEAISDAGVLDRDGQRVLVRVPEQRTWMPSLSRAASSRVSDVAGLMAPPCRSRVDVHASTLRARPRDRVVGRPDSRSDPRRSALLLEVGGGARERGVPSAREPARNLARAYWFDAADRCSLAIAGMLELVAQTRFAGRPAHDAVVRRTRRRGHGAAALRAPALPVRRAGCLLGAAPRRSRSSTDG